MGFTVLEKRGKSGFAVVEKGGITLVLALTMILLLETHRNQFQKTTPGRIIEAFKELARGMLSFKLIWIYSYE